MNASFELALNAISETIGGLPYISAIRRAEKEGRPHIMVYIKDDVFASGKYRNAIPESVAIGDEAYTVGVAPESEAMNLLLAVWKMTEDE